ncbi:MAG: RagB/SusD family nutrient uptake outer membrane protein [Bacteroidaceae bacterium]|nr:RagB/SusD family nutrient uptake outer membrane protein [Bacteroidaceae bacterium]
MKFNKYIKVAVALAGVALASSCQDWLTVYPQNKVVEENFWEDRNDLEGVRYAAYKQMCSTLEKMVLWGDLRSDSYTLSNADISGDVVNHYRNIREGRIELDSANTYFEYTGFYTTINYCNKVLQHGQEVLDRDKQFTSAEWDQMKAEMTALRALNYFYLIRAFKDVPYSTKVVNNDSEVQAFGATNQLVVLDSLILDVESVRGHARNRFTSLKDSKGMITNCAIYALLSDMYLWRASLHQGRGLDQDSVVIRNLANTSYIPGVLQNAEGQSYVNHTVTGDYQLAIDYADKALAALAKQTLENNKGFGTSLYETCNYGLGNCDMYENKFENFVGGNSPQLIAYQRIFKQGNSDESILELQFNTSDNRANEVVTSWWGYGNRVHLAVSNSALATIYSDDNLRNRDARLWYSAWRKLSSESTDLPAYYCFKWSGCSFSTPSSNKCEDIKIITDQDKYSNWIIYRMTDLMLQKAEAFAQLKQQDSCLCYINAVHRRWYCNDDKNVTSQPGDNVLNNNGKTFYSSSAKATIGNIPTPTQSVKGAEQWEIAVMNERQLEFLGEGKRWFDLVRYAERHAGGQNGTQDPREWTEATPIGNGKAGIDKMVDNFLKSEFQTMSQTLKNRFKNRYGLYNLIYYMEIKASNGALEQNPVWNKSTYDQ